MLEYKHVEALAKVVEQGGFERAARVLFLTQSAISQRVRLLEEACGQVLISRSAPPKPTPAGKVLLKHYQQVRLLEDGLAAELTQQPDGQLSTLSIGINADSLAHWFIDVMDPVFKQMNLLIDLRVDDQEQTHEYLREGEVVGCISTEAKPMQGCRVDALGSIKYRLLAAPAFIERWFPNGLTLTAAACAPAVLFNRKDHLQDQFFQQYLGGLPANFPAHYLPALEAFLQVIIRGHSYGMVPDWQADDYLATGQLVELLPGKCVNVELFWHCWNLAAQPLATVSEQLVVGTREILAGKVK